MRGLARVLFTVVVALIIEITIFAVIRQGAGFGILTAVFFVYSSVSFIGALMVFLGVSLGFERPRLAGAGFLLSGAVGIVFAYLSLQGRHSAKGQIAEAVEVILLAASTLFFTVLPRVSRVRMRPWARRDQRR